MQQQQQAPLTHRLQHRLLRRKPMDSVSQLDTKLKRCLTTWHLLFYGMANMAGAGMYVLTGTIVKEKAGPSASLSFLLCGIAFAFTSVCYSEFSTLMPRAGGCYTFTYAMINEGAAFVIGWSMVAENIIGLAAVAKSFSGTVDSLANGAITNFTATHLGTLPPFGIFDDTWDLLAVGMLLILALINVTGAFLSQSLNLVMMIIELMFMVLIGVMCFVYGSADNYSAGDGFFAYGFAGVLRGSAVAVFAFSGFETISNAAEEAKNPRRSLPAALLGSLASMTVLYVFINMALPYLTPYYQVNTRSPFAAAFKNSKAGAWMSPVSGAATIHAAWVGNLASSFVVPRLLYALASDGLIFSCFARVTKLTGVPTWSLAFSSGCACFMALLFRMDALANLVSMATLLAYVVIGINLFYLRYLFVRDEGKESGMCQLRPFMEKMFGHYGRILKSRRSIKIIGIGFLILCCSCGIVLNLATPLESWWSWLLTAVVFVSLLKLSLLLCCYQPLSAAGDSFQTPLMPLPALLSIFFNILMLASLNIFTWLRFFVWTIFGLGIYFLTVIFQEQSNIEKSGGDYTQLEGDTQTEKKESEPDETSPFALKGK